MCGFIERFLALYAAKPRPHPHHPSPRSDFDLEPGYGLRAMVCELDWIGLGRDSGPFFLHTDAICRLLLSMPIHKSCAFWGSAFIKFSHTWLSTRLRLAGKWDFPKMAKRLLAATRPKTKVQGKSPDANRRRFPTFWATARQWHCDLAVSLSSSQPVSQSASPPVIRPFSHAVIQSSSQSLS